MEILMLDQKSREVFKKIYTELHLIRRHCSALASVFWITANLDSDGDIYLALLSNCRATTTRRNVLGVQDNYHLLGLVLIPKGDMVTNNRPRHALKYCVRSKEPFDPYFSCAKVPDKRHIKKSLSNRRFRMSKLRKPGWETNRPLSSSEGYEIINNQMLMRWKRYI